MEEEEIWKDIIGYEGLYQISSLGRVKSLERILRRNDGINRQYKESFLKYKKRNNYLRIILYKNNTYKNFDIHRLVGIHFIEVDMNLIKNLEINHIDGNRENNNIKNLEWVNKRENTSHNKIGINFLSKFIGVYWVVNHKNFRSTIFNNGKTESLGCSINEIDCAETYLEFCKNNNIENKYAFEIYNDYCLENNIENKFLLEPNKRDWVNRLKLESDNKKSSILIGVGFRKDSQKYRAKLTFSIDGEKAKEHTILTTKSEHEAGKAILDKLLSLGRNEITDALAFQKYNEYCKINNIENTYPIPNFKI
jgi:hypothetical protein